MALITGVNVRKVIVEVSDTSHHVSPVRIMSVWGNRFPTHYLKKIFQMPSDSMFVGEKFEWAFSLKPFSGALQITNLDYERGDYSSGRIMGMVVDLPCSKWIKKIFGAKNLRQEIAIYMRLKPIKG